MKNCGSERKKQRKERIERKKKRKNENIVK